MLQFVLTGEKCLVPRKELEMWLTLLFTDYLLSKVLRSVSIWYPLQNMKRRRMSKARGQIEKPESCIRTTATTILVLTSTWLLSLNLNVLKLFVYLLQISWVWIICLHLLRTSTVKSQFLYPKQKGFAEVNSWYPKVSAKVLNCQKHLLENIE